MLIMFARFSPNKIIISLMVLMTRLFRLFMWILESLDFTDVQSSFNVTIYSNCDEFTLKVAVGNDKSCIVKELNVSTRIVQSVIPCVSDIDLNVLNSCSAHGVVVDSHLAYFLGLFQEYSPPWSFFNVSCTAVLSGVSLAIVVTINRVVWGLAHVSAVIFEGWTLGGVLLSQDDFFS